MFYNFLKVLRLLYYHTKSQLSRMIFTGFKVKIIGNGVAGPHRE